MTVKRPKPKLDADNRAFWTGGAEGQLMLFRCHDCKSFIHPPSALCRRCFSENVGPEAVAGTGVIDSYTINYQAWVPGLEVPFVIARVSVDGAPGVYLTTNIINGPVHEVDIGDKVRVTFEQRDEIYYPLFEKVTG